MLPQDFPAQAASVISCVQTAYSFAGAALVLLIVGSWLVVDRIQLRNQLAELHAKQDSQAAQQTQLQNEIASERARNQGLTSELERQQRQSTSSGTNVVPQRPTQTTSPVIVALSLLPGISRGGNAVPQLIVTKNVNTVRLQIGIDPAEDHSSFQVQVLTDRGRQVLTRGRLVARRLRSGKAVPLNVPANLLTAGRYELALKGITASGATENVGYYYFDVVKK